MKESGLKMYQADSFRQSERMYQRMGAEKEQGRATVSVIIPVYNLEERIENSVRSVLEQTIQDMQIILVDDCSKDASYECCVKLASKDSRVAVYRHTENKGVSAARNTGLLYATGKYILFVDGDDILDRDMVSVLIDLIEEEDCVDMAVCGYYRNDMPQYGPEREKIRMGRLQCAKAIAGVGGSLVKGYVANKLFKSELIFKNQIRFDENMYVCEDSLFCLQYVWNCRSVNYDPACKYHYIFHSASATHGKVTPRRMSVINTYLKIIETGKMYGDQDLDDQMEANYMNHYLSLLKDIVKCSSGKQRDYGNRLYSYIRENRRKYRKNPYITLKRKVLFIILYVAFPLWKAMPDRGR